jgi:hypothetical protein
MWGTIFGVIWFENVFAQSMSSYNISNARQTVKFFYSLDLMVLHSHINGCSVAQLSRMRFGGDRKDGLNVAKMFMAN